MFRKGLLTAFILANTAHQLVINFLVYTCISKSLPTDQVVTYIACLYGSKACSPPNQVDVHPANSDLESIYPSYNMTQWLKTIEPPKYPNETCEYGKSPEVLRCYEFFV